MAQPFISGQVITRNMGDKDGRTLFMIVGLVAVPKGQEWQDEHQYAVLAFNNEQLSLVSPTPPPTDTRAMTPGQMLTAPIWRV